MAKKISKYLFVFWFFFCLQFALSLKKHTQEIFRIRRVGRRFHILFHMLRGCCGMFCRFVSHRNRNRNCDDGCDFGLGRNSYASASKRATVSGSTRDQRDLRLHAFAVGFELKINAKMLDSQTGSTQHESINKESRQWERESERVAAVK